MLRRQDTSPRIRRMLWQQGESDAERGGRRLWRKPLASDRPRAPAVPLPGDAVRVAGPGAAAAEHGRVARQGAAGEEEGRGSGLRQPVGGQEAALVVKTDDLSQRANDRNTKYPDDHLHFGTAGTLELGRRMADRIADAMAAKK